MAVFDDRLRLLAAPSLPMLAKLAGAKNLGEFWEALIGLLQIAVPHHTAVVACNYSVTVFREGHNADKDALQGSRSNHPLNAHHLVHYAGEQFPRDVLALTPEKLHRSEDHYQQHIEPSGWEYALVLPFWENSLNRGSVVLYRTAAQGEFLDGEVASLHEQKPVFEAALLRLLDQQRQRAAHVNVVDFLRDLPVGLIMLNWDFQPAFVNTEGYKQTQLWNYAPQKPPKIDPKDDFRLPDDLRRICETIRGRWFNAMFEGQPLGADSVEKAEHPHRVELKATVSVSHLHENLAEPPNFLIRYSGMASRIDHTFQPTRAQLSILAQLTPTERSVTMLTIRGMSNQEIAQQLNREISTVKDHLSHIFDKLGIRSRSQLTSLLTQ